MEQLFIHVSNEVVKARKVEAHEQLKNPIRWKEIEFEYVDSSFMMINWPILLPELEPEAAQGLLDLVGARYPFSPLYDELKAKCPQLLFQQETDEWVFFGGSFNPWHKGHQACLDLLPVDKYCFILPDRNPLKELKVLSPVPTIIELVTKIKFNKHHFIAPTFLLDFQKNPTVTWIEKVRGHFPGKQLSLLMGFDSFKGIQSWHRYQDLLKQLNHLYVVSRLESDQERDDALKIVQDLNPSLQVHYLGRHAFESISSTQLRNQKI